MNLNQVSYEIRRLNTMNVLAAKTMPFTNPFNSLNYSTFDLTMDMTMTSTIFPTNSISKDTLHPWIDTGKFQYACFDIKAQKSKDLMGALTQMQTEQSNPFDISIKITPINQLNPFANFLAGKKQTEVSMKTSQFDFWMNPTMNLREDVSVVKNVNEFERSQRMVQKPKSVFSELIQQEVPDFNRMLLWEQNEDEISMVQSSIVYQPNERQLASVINQTQSHYFQTAQILITEQELIIHLILALQRIQSKMFVLDYETMVWSLRPQINFAIEFYVSGSVYQYINQILSICNIRSKLDLVLEYIVVKEFRREIYSKLLEVYSNSLRLFESILMIYLGNPQTFMQFYVSLQPIKRELNLLLTLLVKQQFLKKEPFRDFRKQFLNNETEIFKFLLQKLTSLDFCQEDQKHLIRSLGLSCFSTILYFLNVFLHSNRQQWEKANNQQFYFGLLFEDRKEDVDRIADRLSSINQDDLEIYNICKETLSIKITMDYSQLVVYQNEWKMIFKSKKKQIKRIARRMEKQRQSKLQEIIEQKANEIKAMKRELAEKLAISLKIKSQNREKQKMLIEVYKNEIQKKIEAKKLLKLIEIEQEKGYLLDEQLKEKDMLLNKKYDMLAEHPELIKKRMSRIEEGVRVGNWSANKNRMIESSASKEQQQKQMHNPHLVQQQANELPINTIFHQHFPPPIPSSRQLEKKPDNRPAYIKYSSLKQSPFVRRPSMRSLTGSIESNVQFFEDLSQPSESEKEDVVDLIEHEETLKRIQMEVPIKISLEVCVYSVLKGQVQVLDLAYQTILYHKYRLSEIFSFLHKYILTANGEHATNLLNLSVDVHSFFNINYLKDYFFSENIKDEITALEPVFYRSDNSPMVGNLNLIQPTTERSLEVAIGLKFHKLPEILKPIFNYIQMTRYMEIFAFSLRIRHCIQLIELEWKTLQSFERTKSKMREKFDNRLLRRLFDIRYKMQCFFNLFQNYFFLIVIERQYKLLEQEILRKQEIQNLPNIHNKFLEKIILRGLIQTRQEPAGRFKKTFILVKEFHNIVGLFCGDDIDTYAQPDVEERLRRIEREFVELYKILQRTVG